MGVDECRKKMERPHLALTENEKIVGDAKRAQATTREEFGEQKDCRL